MDYDELVVGGGSAGWVYACERAKQGARVLLCEAGPDDLPPQKRSRHYVGLDPTDHDWGYRTTTGMHYPRAKVLGGGSMLNGAVALRPLPADIDAWPDPWTWERLLSHFVAIERDWDMADAPYHGGSGPLPIGRDNPPSMASWAFLIACRESGIELVPDLNAPDAEGAGLLPLNAIRGQRVGVRDAWTPPPSLRVRCNTPVHRVIDHGVLTGTETLTAERVTLAAGAINTPLLLTRSGWGTLVRRAHEHLAISLWLPLAEGMAGAVARAGPIVQAGARLTTTRDAWERCTLQILPFFFPDTLRLTAVHLVPETSLCWFDRPDGVQLTDPVLAPADVPDLVAGLRCLTRLATTPPLRHLHTGRVPMERDGAGTVRETVEWFMHPCGSVPMGESVDAQGYVMSWLRVVDASIIPRPLRANPHLTIVALAHALAHT